MSKFTPENLSRGVKLTLQHIYNLPNHIASTLNSAERLIQANQMKQGRAPFRITFNVPVVDGHFVNNDIVQPHGPTQYDFCIPFCLPPLQEFWNASGSATESMPQVVLDEVQISFDQRGEGAVIADGLYNNGATGNEGKLNYDETDAYNMHFSIMEKRQTAFGNADKIPQREIFSAELPGLSFSARSNRLNPWIVDNLNRPVHPYRSYLLMLNVNALHQPDAAPVTHNSHALVSLTISLKFRHPLVSSDVAVGAAEVQNVPSSHDGDPLVAAPTLTITTPAGDSDIEFDTSDGVQTNYRHVDNLAENRWNGGFTKDSDRPGYSHLKHDCGYDVIALPLFGNLTNNRKIDGSAASVNNLPYTGAGSGDPGGDRRIYPLHYPFTVHHAVAVTNYVSGLIPTRAGFITEIGVGVFSGHKADLYEYQQVAYATYNPTNKSALLIDQIKSRLNSDLNGDVAEWELFQIPLVVQGGNNGAGYYTQGRPFWCGKSTSRLAARRNVGDVGGANRAPYTAGCEQYIEVRWTLEEAGGLDQAADDQIFVGYGGHWVLLFGKRGLVGPGDIPV